MTCSIEPISYAKAAIGPAGGTLRIGRHTLTVPAGALSTTVEISGLTVMDATASVHLYPSGLVFRTPATLRLDYGHCDKIKNTKFVVYTDDDALRILEVMPSADRPAKNFVEGKLDHFSRYAVAW
ncbi:MAG: hypothetical protein FJ206_12410 [Gemmatimonadetes bacterium]|nr:hypothetical protein [Gemmatimonadota bacterium]